VDNRVRDNFSGQSGKRLSIFFTAGYPLLSDTPHILEALLHSNVDFVEVGFPFSDPVADGPTIQRSSEEALKNGMNLEVLFSQLASSHAQHPIPKVLMGYINPVLQFGIERFFARCAEVGVQALIIPDLPLEEYQREWKRHYEQHGILPVFLVTARTPLERIKILDEELPAFIYVVSSEATTGGGGVDFDALNSQLKAIRENGVSSPLIVGFGISSPSDYEKAIQNSDGAIIGSAFIRRLENVLKNGAGSPYRIEALKAEIATYISEFNPVRLV
jgi:tryptophan synthase alpha chain